MRAGGRARRRRLGQVQGPPLDFQETLESGRLVNQFEFGIRTVGSEDRINLEARQGLVRRPHGMVQLQEGEDRNADDPVAKSR